MVRSLTSLVFLIAFAGPGCAQSDCEVACEATKECPQANSVFLSTPCGDACDFMDEQAERDGCRAEWDAFNACGADNADLACEQGTCGAEAQAWSACLDANE